MVLWKKQEKQKNLYLLAINKKLKKLNLVIEKRKGESADSKINRIINHIKNNGVTDEKIIDNFSYINNTYYEINQSDIPRELIFLNQIIKSHMPEKVSDKYNSTFTVAYEGIWGTGKTSRIKFFCKHFKYNSVYINLWKFSNINNLHKIKELILMEVLSSIRPITGSLFKVNQIIEKDSTEDEKTIKKNLKKVGVSISALTAGSGLSFEFDNMKEKHKKSLEKLTLDKAPETLGEISHLVRQTLETLATNKPLILILDDIDRVETKYAYEILQAIRSVLEIKGIVSIIPINKNKILNKLLYQTPEDKMQHIDYEAEIMDKINFMDKFFNYSIFSANNQILNKGEVYEQTLRNKK